MQKNTQIQPGFLRPAMAARYLGVSPRTLRAWLAGSRIPHAKLGHRVVVIKKDDLDAFVAAHSAGVPQ